MSSSALSYRRIKIEALPSAVFEMAGRNTYLLRCVSMGAGLVRLEIMYEDKISPGLTIVATSEPTIDEAISRLVDFFGWTLVDSAWINGSAARKLELEYQIRLKRQELSELEASLAAPSEA